MDHYSVPLNLYNVTFGYTLVQFSPVAQSGLSVTPWTAGRQASLPITNFRSLLKLMSIKLVMPSNHLILCHPLLLLPSIIPSIRVFSYTIVNWGEKRGDRAESQGNETGANRNDLRPTKIKQRSATLCSYCGNCRMCLKYTLETVGSGPQVAMKAA